MESTKVEESMPQITDDTPGVITTTNVPTEEPVWQEYLDVINSFLTTLPDELASFFSDNKKPLTSIGLIIAGAIAVYITIAVLDAINNIPLLSPILELVGIGYFVWFASRYLINKSARSELIAEYESLKQRILG